MTEQAKGHSKGNTGAPEEGGDKTAAQEGRHEITMPSVADLRHAASLRDALEAAWEEGGLLIVRAQDVERISTPCIQVLISAARTVAQEGAADRFRVVAPSPEFREAFQDLGLESLLEEWSRTHA